MPSKKDLPEIVLSDTWLKRVAQQALSELKTGPATREKKYMSSALESFLNGESLERWFPTPKKRPGRPKNLEKNRKVSLRVVIYRAAGYSKAKAIELVTEEFDLEEDQVKMIYERSLDRPTKSL